MGLLMWLVACMPAVDPDLDCDRTPWALSDVDVAVVPDASGLPTSWTSSDTAILHAGGDELDLSVDPVSHGRVHVDGGLWLDEAWGDDWDMRWHDGLLLWDVDAVAWTSESGWTGEFRGVASEGIDVRDARVVDRIHLDLDGFVFLDTAVVEVVTTRKPVLGEVSEHTETAWMHRCVGLVAHRSGGRGWRVIP